MTDERVDILDERTGEVVGECHGPTTDGTCPYSTPSGVVGCEGRRIAPTEAGSEYWMLWVPPNSRHCPLAWNLAAACI